MPLNRDRLKPYLRWLGNPGWLYFTWFGMSAGITLLETPLRFRAPAMSREAALDLGRVVFTTLNKAELVALALALLLTRVGGLAPRLWGPVALLALVLLAQSAWLLPELSARSLDAVAGRELPPSPVHALYSALELAKYGLLLFLGFRSLEMVRGSGR